MVHNNFLVILPICVEKINVMCDVIYAVTNMSLTTNHLYLCHVSQILKILYYFITSELRMIVRSAFSIPSKTFCSLHLQIVHSYPIFSYHGFFPSVMYLLSPATLFFSKYLESISSIFLACLLHLIRARVDECFCHLLSQGCPSSLSC